MMRVFVAAGSNIDPLANLRLARDELERTFGAVTLSTAWQNAAVGFDGPDFVNVVAAFDTDYPVEAVVAELQRIESLCGRTRDAPKWAPRSMDLDILLYGDLICERPGLTLPRPDLLRRPYMLGPMAEIAPGLRHPTAGETFASLWARFPRDHAMRRVDL